MEQSKIKELKEKIKATFSASEDARFVRRLDVLAIVLDGRPVDDTAKMFGFHRSTVYGWLRKIKTDNIDSLKDQYRPGRKSSLNDSEKEKLVGELKQTPHVLGYNKQRWDGPLLSHHLGKNYQVNLSVRQCQRLFHEMGFSPYSSPTNS